MHFHIFVFEFPHVHAYLFVQFLCGVDISFTDSVLDVEEDCFEGVELEGEGRKEVLMHVQGVQCYTYAIDIGLDISVDAVEITDYHQRQLLSCTLIF